MLTLDKNVDGKGDYGLPLFGCFILCTPVYLKKMYSQNFPTVKAVFV